MAMGALIGSFEECIPLVPLVIALATNLGWNALTGLGMSLLAAGCGFASGVCNPFTVGVAQEVAGLPMFSGMWLRMLSFLLIYGLLLLFLRFYVKKIERPLDNEIVQGSFTGDKAMDRGLLCFVGIVGTGILLVLSSIFLTFFKRSFADKLLIFFTDSSTSLGMTARRHCRLDRQSIKELLLH